MNKQEVISTISKVYDVEKDQIAQVYIEELNDVFEPEAYANDTVAEIIRDVEITRKELAEDFKDPRPYIKDEGVLGCLGALIAQYYVAGSPKELFDPSVIEDAAERAMYAALDDSFDVHTYESGFEVRLAKMYLSGWHA